MVGVVLGYWCWCLHNGGDGGDGRGRKSQCSECGDVGDGFCKGGYFIVLGVL